MRRTRLGRPADRMELIVSSLRSEIVLGKLKPGYRLPARTDIERHYGASSVTVQRALTRLSTDGFIRVDRTLGTFVSDTPPHLSRYALVFPTIPKAYHPFNRMYSTLIAASSALESQRGIEIAAYYDVTGHVDAPDYIRLVDDISAQRLSGLIFAAPPYLLASTPIMTTPGLPRVSIGSSSSLGVPCVAQTPNAVARMAFRALAQSGRRRVAVVAAASRSMDTLVSNSAEAGLETRSYWLLRIDLATPATAREVVHLLMNPNQIERPDALFIDDDNLIEPAIAGLLDAGVRVPQDLEVIAHTNLPWGENAPIPMRNLGVDAREMMSTCLKRLEGQRAETRVEPITHIDPVFESEITPSLLAAV